ncbi:uncharacterized protein TrAFT101_002551 [Trichoderma asperellum]|uniref:uncharacterized protein n=1 Tax=Trichoderma asperellum TaxID=101201 RepID=UPI003329F9D3|nr:hypothetical protein TrAFT101_002551 [Trichoderma asperellum]
MSSARQTVDIALRCPDGAGEEERRLGRTAGPQLSTDGEPFRFRIGESLGSCKIAWAALNDMGCTYFVGRFSKGGAGI